MKQKCINKNCKHGNWDVDALTPCEKCKQDAIDIVAGLWADKLKRERDEMYRRHKNNGHERREE